MRRHARSDAEGALISPRLPKKGRDAPQMRGRRVIDAVFRRFRTGAPWRDALEQCGQRTPLKTPGSTVAGTFLEPASGPASKAQDRNIAMVDSSSRRAIRQRSEQHHRMAPHKEGGDGGMRRSRGGSTVVRPSIAQQFPRGTKIHTPVDARERPIPATGQAGDPPAGQARIALRGLGAPRLAYSACETDAIQALPPPRPTRSARSRSTSQASYTVSASSWSGFLTGSSRSEVSHPARPTPQDLPRRHQARGDTNAADVS